MKPGWQGRFLEDFTVGDIYQSRIGRTITQSDNTWFTLLTNNTNQIHFNREYGRHTEFKDVLVNSALTLAIVAGLGVADISENGFALGWDEVRLPAPLFVGDTLYSESEVVDVRPSRSRPEWGIVKVQTWGLNQHGTVVIEYKRSVMVRRRAYAAAGPAFPMRRGTDAMKKRSDDDVTS